MSPLLLAAMAAISLAFVLYTIGVFSERHAGTLTRRHLLFFWLGFVCDTTGTSIMTFMAQNSGATGSPLHAISGVIAIALMLFHASWATVVIAKDDRRWRASFHRLSIVVWLFWLIPYVIGMLMGIPPLHVGATAASIIAIALVVVLALFFCLKANAQRRRAA